MRRVYHGSVEVVSSPLLNVGRSNLDFGLGFLRYGYSETGSNLGGVEEPIRVGCCGYYQ